MNKKNGRLICRVQSRRREREGGGGGEKQVREKMKGRSMNTFFYVLF